MHACVCHVGASVKLLSNILKRMVSASFGGNLIKMDFAAKFYADWCNLNYFGVAKKLRGYFGFKSGAGCFFLSCDDFRTMFDN